MSKTKLVQKKDGQRLSLQVSGYIGENSEFFEVDMRGLTDLDVDLAGVNYLNSIGVKNWILWTRRIPTGVKVSFHNCPSLVINQMSTVAGFLPAGASVQSLFVPYHCDNCSKDDSLLVHRGQQFEFGTSDLPRRVEILENKPCPDCKSPMEADVIEEKFFSFLDFKPSFGS